MKSDKPAADPVARRPVTIGHQPSAGHTRRRRPSATTRRGDTVVGRIQLATGPSSRTGSLSHEAIKKISKRAIVAAQRGHRCLLVDGRVEPGPVNRPAGLTG
jgi:hypothetical protein